MPMATTSAIITTTAPTAQPTAFFPVDDWQFWVVTFVFTMAIAWLCWNVLPIRQILRKGRAAPKRTALTVEGKKPKDGGRE